MRLLAASLLILLSASISFGQTNDEGLAFLQFNFLNPGARSLAMGGAFVGRADDATAAVANPAGLTTLIRPEISVEYSASNYENEIPWNAGLQTLTREFTGTAIRDFNYLNIFNPADYPETVHNISFASFVYPVSKNKFVLAGFYNEQTKFERAFQTAGMDFLLDDQILNQQVSGIYFPTRNSLNLSIKNIGVSAGFQPSEKFSFGVTLAASQLDIESSTSRLGDPRVGSSPDDILNIESLSGDDTQLAFALGALIEPSDKVSFGAVYTGRPEYDVTSRFEVPSVPDFNHESAQTLATPDSFAFGVSLQPNDKFTLNVDVVHILYSQLMDGYYNAFFSPGIAEIQPGITNLNTDPDFQITTVDVDDGTEFRVGAEYVAFLGSHPFSIRAGYWREPFHSIRQNVDDSQLEVLFDLTGVANDTNDAPFYSNSFDDGADHITFGTGIVVGHVSIDWAYDYSREFRRFVISTVIYIGK